MSDFPQSTYRIQFHAGFKFRDAAGIVPYLAKLGITHLYASPYLVARPGSTHGYDVIDHGRLNPELGTQADYDALVQALRAHKMGHILDTVPNHMGVATNDNAWWNDVLENGPQSRYAKYFDIAWEGSPRPHLHGKVLLPLLGDLYGSVLERGELKLAIEDGKTWVKYWDRRFPINPASVTEKDISRYNGTPGDPRSFDRLDDLLNHQFYRLAYWRVAPDEINYRRFFDINDLAALSMERKEVFDSAHAFIFKLLSDGKLDGLRIDHPDGLYDPKQYFERLAKDSPKKPLYATVEKILAPDEPLPGDWPVHGTSGYDFLIQLNGLFVDSRNKEQFTRIYEDFTGETAAFADLAYEKKRLILRISLASELHMLAHQLDRLAQTNRHGRDFTLTALIDALREVIACFPVYRSYISSEGVKDSDVRYVEHAIAEAIRRNPQTEPAIFRFIGDAVLQKFATGETQADWLHFAGKFQQVTAPATAKGIEDTAFYIYNRFISLNEVGGEPGHFGSTADALHAYLADRQKRWPFALSALSTHDTKRSEDVRARLNVLSEMPDEWQSRVNRWAELNARHKTGASPSRNEEYLLYQTLVGAWPLEPGDNAEFASFAKRIGTYMEKAMREAKVHTSWTNVNESHEKAVQDFVAAILDESRSGEFLRDIRSFVKQISRAGLLNSLAQTLVKITAPGVPDTYQGTELWDFSLVDPDNRRPVDYAKRARMLEKIDDANFAELLKTIEDGHAKLFLIRKALSCRLGQQGLFTEGEYIPLSFDGDTPNFFFAFARRMKDKWAVVIVRRLQTLEMPDAVISLPAALPARLRNVLTNEALTVDGPLRVRSLLGDTPAALWLNDD